MPDIDGELEFADERRVNRFYLHEAMLLTQRRYVDWEGLLTDDIIYRVPIRVNRAVGTGPEHSADGFLFDETRRTIRMRIERFSGSSAWAENPASRMRYFVANLRAQRSAEPGGYDVVSDLLFTRLHGTNTAYEMLTGERHDLLRECDGALRLARRTVLLDNSTLPTHNLAFFL